MSRVLNPARAEIVQSMDAFKNFTVVRKYLVSEIKRVENYPDFEKLAHRPELFTGGKILKVSQRRQTNEQRAN